jgi:hypothetical protein
MDVQDIRNLQEAYLEVVENQRLDEAKSDEGLSDKDKIAARRRRQGVRAHIDKDYMDSNRQALHRGERGVKKQRGKKSFSPIRHGERINYSNDRHPGQYSLMKHPVVDLSPKEKSDRMAQHRRSVSRPLPKVGGKKGLPEQYDLYDIILSHLLDEGYAETPEAAEKIMVNMSEEWKEEILDEAYQEPKFNRKAYLKKLSKRGGMGMGTPDDPHGYRDSGMAKVGAEFSKRKTAAAKAKKTGEPDEYRTEKEAQSKMR